MNFRLVFALIGGVVGAVIGGITENILWSAGDIVIETVSDCENLKNGWDEICKQNRFLYYIGQNILKISGFVVGFIGVLKLSKK